MEKFYDMFSDIRKTILLSTIIHILILLFFLLFHVGINFETSEFSEISFVASTSTQVTASKPEIEKTSAVQQEPVAATPAPEKPVHESKAEPVNLPKRRMLEDDKPEIINRTTGKLTPQIQNERIHTPSQEYGSDRVVQHPGASTSGEKLSTGPSDTPLPGTSSGPVSDIGTINQGQPFTIEGDAAKRSILKQVIPKYPVGLQKEAVVKIRFTVLPDGRVGQMIPVQKGDSVLDEITMKSLQQWRFNPLSPSAEQKNVQGIITFRYELE